MKTWCIAHNNLKQTKQTDVLVDIFSNLESSSLRNKGFIQQSSLNAMYCMSLSHDKIL